MHKLRFLILVPITTILLSLVGCSEANIASSNLSTASDNFQIDRRVIFYNGITGTYMLTITGKCSIHDQRTQLEVTCKLDNGGYKKHFLGLSDNVTYFVEQLYPQGVNSHSYAVVFNPQVILPDIKVRASLKDLKKAVIPQLLE